MEYDEESAQTSPSESGLPSPKPLEKAPTYITGLDEILEGGLPRGRTTVTIGTPGSGKTVLGLEFLYRGAQAGEPGIYVGFEEPIQQIRQNAATLGWDLAALERDHRLFLLEGRIKPDTLLSGEFSLKGLLAAVAGKSQEMGAKRIVIDALEVILRLFDTPQQVRNEMHTLNEWLLSCGLTTIMTVKPSIRGTSIFEDFFESMSDCVIRLDTWVADQVSTRRLRIIKYRGSGFGRNEYPYMIAKTGLHIAPISTVGLRHKPLGEKMPTGIERLDAILDGGYRRASCILVAGQPGTGKTLLVSTFTNAACRRGEKILYVSYEESDLALMGNLLSAGMDLRPHVAANQLAFLTNMPEAIGAEEHFLQVMARIQTFAPQHVVVDAISACERMGGKQAAFEYLMRLLNTCKERGITILLVNQTSGTRDHLEISGNGISSMIDTIIFMNYIEGAGETNRLIEVLKSRGSAHSNQKREYVITSNGLQILGLYVGKGAVLTGAARQLQEARDTAEAERLAFEIQIRELELQCLKHLQSQAARERVLQGELRGEGTGSAQPESGVNLPDERKGQG